MIPHQFLETVISWMAVRCLQTFEVRDLEGLWQTPR